MIERISFYNMTPVRISILFQKGLTVLVYNVGAYLNGIKLTTINNHLYKLYWLQIDLSIDCNTTSYIGRGRDVCTQCKCILLGISG
jgi:hypothetical protein